MWKLLIAALYYVRLVRERLLRRQILDWQAIMARRGSFSVHEPLAWLVRNYVPFYIFFFLVFTASWHKPALISGSTVLAVFVILIIFWTCYRRSKRLKEAEQRGVSDNETGQEERYHKEQEQEEYNEKQLDYNRVVVEESSETKLAAKAADGNVTYKQTIVTWHL